MIILIIYNSIKEFVNLQIKDADTKNIKIYRVNGRNNATVTIKKIKKYILVDPQNKK